MSGEEDEDAMTGAELAEIRQRFGMTPAQFGSMLGYTGNRNTLDLLIRRYESGAKVIPLYLARYIWLIDQVCFGTGLKFNSEGFIKWPPNLRSVPRPK